MRKYGAKLLLFAHLFVKVCKKSAYSCGQYCMSPLFFVVSTIGLKCMVGIRSAGKTKLVLPAQILHTVPLLQ